VRKMRLGTLNAGVLTEVGIAEIDRSVYALSVPMAFASYEEVDYVLDKMRASLEAKIEAKGFVVLFWADTGWCHVFFTGSGHPSRRLQAHQGFRWGHRR